MLRRFNYRERTIGALVRILIQADPGSAPMTRNICLNVLAMAFVLAIAGSVSPASAIEAIQDRYCLQGETYGYPGNCQFSSYQQCMATASGTHESCGINPLRAFEQQRPVGNRGRYTAR